MGTKASKSALTIATGGGAVGLALLYLSYMEEIKKDKEESKMITEKVMENLKEKFLLDNYGDQVAKLISICREEMRNTDEQNLLLTLKFFKCYSSIVDIMSHKSIQNLRKKDLVTRLNLLKKFDFSSQMKIHKKFVKEKLSIVKESEDILTDILNLDPEQMMASKIQLIRQKPKEYISKVFVKGPITKIQRGKAASPDHFDKAAGAIEFVTKRIIARNKRGFNSVDTTIFRDMFEEELIDELLVRYGLNLEQFMGVCVKLMENEVEQKNEENRREEEPEETMEEEAIPGSDDEAWKDFEPKVGEIGEQFLDMVKNYVDMLSKMYASMTLYEPGIRIQVDKKVILN